MHRQEVIELKRICQVSENWVALGSGYESNIVPKAEKSSSDLLYLARIVGSSSPSGNLTCFSRGGIVFSYTNGMISLHSLFGESSGYCSII